jgi:hypothetical protein
MRVLFGVVAILWLSVACQSGLEEPKPLAPLDEAYFRCHVQPVLTKTCASFKCHGDANRYFHVFARNRLRMTGSEKDRNAALTTAERAANFDAARAFVDLDARQDSLLLMKPVEAKAGGAFHRGATIFGAGNVFSDRNDPDYKTLATWVEGKQEGLSCAEPGSDQ